MKTDAAIKNSEKKVSDFFRSIIKEVSKTLEEKFVGEPCNQNTRDAIFEYIKNQIDVNGYELICDQTNNTPEDVFNSRIVIDIKKSNDQNNL
jgi:hypothetical protein